MENSEEIDEKHRNSIQTKMYFTYKKDKSRDLTASIVSRHILLTILFIKISFPWSFLPIEYTI